MITKSSKYAVRAILYIAKHATVDHKIGSKHIAEKLDIPAPFLAKTLQELSRKEIVTSVKGPNGGFYLTGENRNKTLYDIIAAIDNIHKFDECYLGQLECNDINPCVIHNIFKPFKNKLIQRLQTKTIIEIAKENSFEEFV